MKGDSNSEQADSMDSGTKIDVIVSIAHVVPDPKLDAEFWSGIVLSCSSGASTAAGAVQADTVQAKSMDDTPAIGQIEASCDVHTARASKPVQRKPKSQRDPEDIFRTDGPYVGKRMRRFIFNKKGQIIDFADGVIRGYASVEDQGDEKFINEETKLPAALWEVVFDDKSVGVEHLEENEVTDAIKYLSLPLSEKLQSKYERKLRKRALNERRKRDREHAELDDTDSVINTSQTGTDKSKRGSLMSLLVPNNASSRISVLNDASRISDSGLKFQNREKQGLSVPTLKLSRDKDENQSPVGCMSKGAIFRLTPNRHPALRDARPSPTQEDPGDQDAGDGGQLFTARVNLR